MKTYNHLLESMSKFEDFLESIDLDRDREVLVRVHSSIHSKDDMEVLAADIKKLLPRARMIGCSTSQVICEGKILSEACLISLSVFENCEIRQALISCENSDGTEKDGVKLAEETIEILLAQDSGLMLVFFPVSYYQTAKFVEGINAGTNGVRLVGGVSYKGNGENQIADSYVLGQKVATNCMTALFLTADEFHIYENIVCGVENVGRSYEVTRVHGHCLDKLDDMDAAQWYEEMLGREELSKDPSLAEIFPLINEETQIAYSILYEPWSVLPEPWKSEKRNRIKLYTEISAGMKVALGYFDPQKIVNQMEQVYHELKKEPVESIFAYGCLARMRVLHECAKWEVGQLHTTNMSGALLGGEISNVNGKNIYANATFVVVGVSENADAHLRLKGKGLKNVSALQHDNVQMINYLLARGNKQLNRQLSKQQNKLKKAMSYQETLDLDNETKYLLEREKKNLDKIAVFSLKNERMLRLYLGPKELLTKLKDIYGKLGEKKQNQSYHFYSYCECSFLVAATADVTDKDFKQAMKRLYDYLNQVSFREFTLTYGCAIVFREAEALKRAETALQYGIRNKVPFCVYVDTMESVLNTKEEMHMLQVLKEALVKDWVVPFFQGIRDNRTGKIEIYEALMRIQDGDGSLYFPNQFLALAKEYDLYESLSILMVKKVMRMFLERDAKVTINLNVQDIYDRDMLKMIFTYLGQAPHPENFIFELVESEEVTDYQYIRQFATCIHEYGAQIAIDDFGSGFSNFLHIIRINADYLKIDGELIKEICHDENIQEFVEMIYGWCAQRGKEVVAEFVENKEIQGVLENIGIPYSQGYYFAKPEEWTNMQKRE